MEQLLVQQCLSMNIKETKMPHGKIIRNAVHCLTCDTVVESYSSSDHAICSCGYDSDTRISVSGGLQSLKLEAASHAKFEALYRFEENNES